MFQIWLLHLIPALIGSAPIWFLARHRVHWFVWEFIALMTVPYFFGVLLTYVWVYRGLSRTIGIGNLVGEAVLLGCAIPLAGIGRVVLPGRFDDGYVALGMVLFLCLVRLGLFLFMPTLGK